MDLRRVQDASGWTQLPAVRDMARIQFGRSHCQIEGTAVPVADVALDGGESVYFSHHVMLWRDDGVAVSAMKLKGEWKRMLAGMPLVMCQATGTGHIAFSDDAAGEIVALPIHPGGAVEVREHRLLLASGTTAYDWQPSGIWFTVAEPEGGQTKQRTHFPLGQFLDRFSAPQAPGLVLLHAPGNSFVRVLRPGETILVQPSALLYKDLSVAVQLHIEYPNAGASQPGWQGPGAAIGGLAGAFLGGRVGAMVRSYENRHLWLRCTGPGRVAVVSAFPPLEDPMSQLVGTSPATSWRW